jgi:hypothetical protein
MRFLHCWRKKSFLIFTVGVGGLLWSSVPIHAEQVDPAEPCKGIREPISAHIALGTPDDLIRLQDAFDKTERKLARLQLEVPTEGSAQFAENQQNLKEYQDRLVESEVVFRHLDRYSEETPNPRVDRPSADERASFRDELSGRIIALQKTISTLEKEIRSDHDKYRQCLVVELNDLAMLLTARRADLLAEYTRLPDCHAVDQPCIQKRLRVLCDLKPLVSGAERLRLLRLIAEVDIRLNTGGHGESTNCESL